MMKDFGLSVQYEKGIKVDELFSTYSSGFKTYHAENIVSTKKYSENNLSDYYYRAFDKRYIGYELIKNNRYEFSVIKNMLFPNLAIIVSKQATAGKFGLFVSKGLTDINYIGTAGKSSACLVFPLYLYSETREQQTINQSLKRTPNLNMKIVSKMAQKLMLAFVPEKEPEGKICYINNPEVRDDFKMTFAPVDILDYFYAVLHSRTCKDKYRELLKTGFPRVPFPRSAETFWQLVELGKQMRAIHLLDEAAVVKSIYELPGISIFPEDGNNLVEKLQYTTLSEGKGGKVYINNTQYFDKVPELAWNFSIGAYQPAQNWLKDRKGRTLTLEDILHYQKMIAALTETGRLMNEIDKVEIE
jgi:predicted helicase